MKAINSQTARDGIVDGKAIIGRGVVGEVDPRDKLLWRFGALLKLREEILSFGFRCSWGQRQVAGFDVALQRRARHLDNRPSNQARRTTSEFATELRAGILFGIVFVKRRAKQVKY